MPPAAPRNHEKTRSALECGGLTPPWDCHGRLSTYAERQGGGLTPPWDCHGRLSAYAERQGGGLAPPWDCHGRLSAYAERQGGVKPPHSKAPSAQAFSRQKALHCARDFSGAGAPILCVRKPTMAPTTRPGIILRFQVAMQGAARVGKSQNFAHAPDHAQALGERRR